MAGRLKKQLRYDLKRILTNLDVRWQRAASREVCEQLDVLLRTELHSQEIQHVLAWTKFFAGEADLTQFIGEQLAMRHVYLPRVESDHSMTFVAVDRDWGATLKGGLVGVPEPPLGSGAMYDPIDAAKTIVLVPALAFDREGNRLGRGKGHYDRWLAGPAVQPAVKIGVGWQLQVLDHVPSEFHDVTVDWVCHERGYFRCGA